MSRFQINQKFVVGAVFVSGMLMSSIDATVVNVALATLSREFDIPASSVDTVVIGYLVALAVVIPASGWLGDRFGTKRIFLTALAVFTAASALCGTASSFGELVVFRVLQGAGGGMLTPVGQAMLYRAFPPNERVRASRILIFPRILGPACGPVLGGLLVTKLSWHWVFYVNIPVGVIVFLFALLFLNEHKEPTAGGFDIAGFVLAGTGFALVMFALSEGPARGWSSPTIMASGIVGILTMVAFVLVELRVAEPMVQLRLLSNRLFNTTNLVTMFSTSGFQGILFLVPLFLQEARGESALQSGLTTFPEAIGVVVSTQIVARMYPKIGPRRLMAGGLVGVATSIALLTTIDLGTNSWLIRALMFMIGVGMAYIFLPSQAAGFTTISRESMGRASTLFMVQRQIGAAIGVAMLSTVLGLVGPVTHTSASDVVPNLSAYHVAFITAAGFSILAAFIALRVPDKDAAPSMQVRTAAPRRAESAPEPQVADGK